MANVTADLNRHAIDAAKLYIGGTAYLTIALVVIVVIGFITNLWLFAHGFIPAWAATLILAVLTYFSYTPLHESVHGNIHGNQKNLQWLNNLCGYLMAPIIWIPYASHKHEHFTHHRYTNQADKDPDFLLKKLPNGAKIVLAFILMQNTFFVRYHWKKSSLKDKIMYSLEVFFAIAWRLMVLIFVDNLAIFIVIVLGFLIGGFFTAYWFAYRPHIPYENSERYQNTNSLIMPIWMKPLEWFWLGQNLHSIHHLFPRVPFYRYHQLHKKIEPTLIAHDTPIIGIFTRKPVKLKTDTV